MFRHAKSDWSADYGDDLSRPLSQRGLRAAKTMGRFLARTAQLPDSAATSPAVRAERTLQLAMEAGGWSCPVRVRQALYGGVEELLEEVRAEPANTAVLLVVGHEPTWSEAASRLIGGGLLRVPTAAMLRIDFEVDRWANLGAGTGQLAWLVTPKLLSDKHEEP